MAAETPPLSEAEARRILGRLASAVDPDEPEFVLIGGQAVSFWVGQFLDPGRDAEAARLATSKDIDFVGDRPIVEHCAVLLGGMARYPTLDEAGTPSSGLIQFKDSDGVPRQLDFLETAFGVEKDDLHRTAQLVEIPEGPNGEAPFAMWVMHPERLMESRVANLSLPGKQTGLAIDQLRASIRCAHEFGLLLLGSSDLDTQQAVKATLRFNERVFKFAIRERWPPLRDHGVDVFDAIVIDDRLPAEFRNLRYPQMRDQLERQIVKARAADERRA